MSSRSGILAALEEAGGFVQRNSAEVTGFLTRNAVGLVFVIAAGPFADEIDLRKRRHCPQQHEQPRGNES